MSSVQLANQAVAFHRAGQFVEAEQAYRKALKVYPKNADLLMLHGRVLCELGKVPKGLESLRKAAKASPRDSKYRREIGDVMLQLGRYAEAFRAYRKAISIQPDVAVNHYAIGKAHVAIVDMDAAIRAFDKAHELDPDNLDYRYALASSRMRLGELPVDTTHFAYIAEKKPDSAPFQCQYGNALLMNNEFEQAEERFRMVLRMQPQNAGAIGGLSQVFEETGRTEEAAAILEESIRDGTSNYAVRIAYARICRRQKRPHDAIALLERFVDQPGVDRFENMTYHFRLGALREEVGDYDLAWEHWTCANRTHVATWDREAHENQISAIIEAFSAANIKTLARSTNSSEGPVFLVGMFRSGTSLTDQILACHPQVHGAGELSDIPLMASTIHEQTSGKDVWPECAASLPQEALNALADAHLAKLDRLGNGARLVTDKNPWNYMHLGLIWMLFRGGGASGVRIIHLQRDPLDTCLSCYANSFSTSHAYTQNLGDLAHAYGQYRRLMDHWRSVLPIEIHKVRYEELVTDQERVTRDLLGFLNLDWDESCLRFYESKRVLKTLSVDQIRQPLYTGSIGRHTRFEKHLGDLQRGLQPWTTGEPAS